jgi:hypothetical protein
MGHESDSVASTWSFFTERGEEIVEENVEE